MKRHRRTRSIVQFVALLGAASVAPFVLAHSPQPPKDTLGYQDTPLLPDGKWHVHDGLRPQPPVITPPATDGKPVPPPSDAIVLFDGTNLDKWQSGDGKPSGWKLENGYMEVPKRGTPNGGDIQTREPFGSCQLHVEFCEPSPGKGSGQGRGNSGIFLMGKYELQVLDTYGNQTYPDGQTGALYGQTPPLVNAARKPGQWQTYDIFWTAPSKFGDRASNPAFATVIYNGVLVQNHTPLLGPTQHRALAKYTDADWTQKTGPIKFQDHGDAVRFRNVWIRPL